MADTVLAYSYDDQTGRNKAVPQPKTDPKEPLRLRFDFTPEAEAIVKREVGIARTAIDGKGQESAHISWGCRSPLVERSRLVDMVFD